MQKFKTLLSIFLCFSQVAISQHVDEGAYNDWDYGPRGVYGNFKVSRVLERSYYKIERTGPGSAVVRQINSSGVVVNTATVKFANGMLSEVEEANQWGEQYETRQYKIVGIDSSYSLHSLSIYLYSWNYNARDFQNVFKVIHNINKSRHAFLQVLAIT